jgi:hypothetical protein
MQPIKWLKKFSKEIQVIKKGPSGPFLIGARSLVEKKLGSGISCRSYQMLRSA